MTDEVGEGTGAAAGNGKLREAEMRQTKRQIATGSVAMAGALLLAGTAGAQTNCSADSTAYTCSLTATNETTCSPASGLDFVFPGELLTAAQNCDASITASTTLVITAAGGAGSNGPTVLGVAGGAVGKGGAARLATSVADLGSNTQLCFGIGAHGGYSDNDSGAGGASTVLRACDCQLSGTGVTCTQPDNSETTGVLLIGAGGGGGGAGVFAGGTGGGGGQGGTALSSTSGPCPTSDGSLANCVATDPNGGPGGGSQGDCPVAPGGAGGTGGVGGAGAFTSGNAQGGTFSGGAGADGIGGRGGDSEWGQAFWAQGNMADLIATSGAGGSNLDSGQQLGGSGGGGYGGGGSGIGCFDIGICCVIPTGGGGGGSFAAQSSVATTGLTGPSLNNGSDGYLTFEFIVSSD